ncbi:MAG: PHP domain-containing protein [Thermoplasmata archaeon]|nr:MAG: PHP domain-containing protein [Thermoplasmata archaeon]
MRLDLHIHSRYSYDSMMSPKLILKFAELRSLNVISVTDHETMEIYRKEFKPDNLRKLNERNFFVIPGMEVRTEMGDVTGLFLNHEIKSRSFFEVLDEIRVQDGLAILSHPYRRKQDPENIIDHFDLIEVLNGRCRKNENRKASIISDKYDKPYITGSDAHMWWEIGNVYTKIVSHRDDKIEIDDMEELRNILLNKDKTIKGMVLPFYLTHGFSFLIGKLRKGGLS